MAQHSVIGAERCRSTSPMRFSRDEGRWRPSASFGPSQL